MFDLEQELIEIIKNNSIKTALDLGAGSGSRTSFCANNGIETLAVDNQTMLLRQFDKRLLMHPNISFLGQDIESYLEQYNQTFDLVLLLNVIAFIPKEIFLTDLLPKILQIINPQGYLILSFFFDDDPTMPGPNINFYTFDDFKISDNDFEILAQHNIRKDDIHKPYGVHKHRIGYLFLRKNSP